MGGTHSTAAKGNGYHVLRVQENSPAHTAGIEPFFDYIVGINGIQLNFDSPYFQEQLLQNVDKEVILLIYSTKEQEFREVKLIPNKNWSNNSQDGLIGCSIRYCSYESINEHVWHILDIAPDSPAEMAGLVPLTDYVIGTPHATLRSETDFYDLIEEHLGKSLRIYVYNADFDVCREVIIVPNHEWGGEGSLGCGVGYGYLHRIPKTNKFKSREQEFTLSWNVLVQEVSSVPTNSSYYQHYNPENDTITPTLYHIENNNNEQNAEFFTPANLQVIMDPPSSSAIKNVSSESENIIASSDGANPYTINESEINKKEINEEEEINEKQEHYNHEITNDGNNIQQ
ncbi:GRASP55/65 PDZ-like domain-containing protein [Glomus cerebriforme]|uniref:GRASP55/65 PDZ-like domain-containing protein n=1 Tax=Glomus cerebriforme TaxID=658196 RepID=A0A397SC24_9GLOM|nr:GRASP55/65 PDZ-like domain-containing protein [Glomus cerebriforme]